MKLLRSLVFSVLIISFLVLPTGAYGWWKPNNKKSVSPPAVKAIRRNKVKTLRSSEKKYAYIRSHDYNHDGMVNAKDRLIWLNNKGGSYDPVYVSSENEDIVEAFDLDGDGDVESWEMEQIYASYDLNGNGILEESEISSVEY